MKTQSFIKQTMADLGIKSANVFQQLTINTRLSEFNINVYQKSPNLQQSFMKTISKLTVAAMAIAVLSLPSCKKDLNNPVNPGSETNNPGTFKDIKTQPGFNWSTHTKVDFTFKAVPTIADVKATLTVVQLPENKTVITVMQKMNETLNLPLTLPAHVKQLQVSFGSNQATIDIVNNKAEFDLTTLFPNDAE